MRTLTLATALAAACLAAPVMAQDIGQTEYVNSCAQCHGPDGRGGGPLAGYLNTSVPDLTMLQKNNGGVFPIADVYRIIDGSGATGPHGSREMPVWGSRYMVEGAAVANPEFNDEEAEVYARFRILALTEFLSTIQDTD